MDGNLNLMQTMGVTDDSNTPVEGNVAVTAESTVTTDPATAVTAEAQSAPATGNFLAQNKGLIIKGAVGITGALGAAFIVRRILKKRAAKKVAQQFSAPSTEELDKLIEQVQQVAQAVPDPIQQGSSAQEAPANKEPVPSASSVTEGMTLDVTCPSDEVLAEAKEFRDKLVSAGPDAVVGIWQDAAKTARVTGTFFGVPVRGWPGLENVSFERTLDLMMAVYTAMNYWINGGKKLVVPIRCTVTVKTDEFGSVTKIPISAHADIPEPDVTPGTK